MPAVNEAGEIRRCFRYAGLPVECGPEDHGEIFAFDYCKGCGAVWWPTLPWCILAVLSLGLLRPVVRFLGSDDLALHRHAAHPRMAWSHYPDCKEVSK